MDKFEKLIQTHFDSLSKSQRKVAQFLLNYPEQFAVQSASEIGSAVGVSETTVIRFCHALDFTGFAGMQKHVREQLLLKRSNLDQFYSEKVAFSQERLFFGNVMKQDALNIQHTSEQLKEASLEAASKRIIEADKVIIAGMRTSYAAAHWLSFTLRMGKESVHLFRPDTDDPIALLQECTDNTVFIGISFPRYALQTIKMAEYMQERGAYIIGITDSAVAPIQKYADLVLSIQSSNTSTIDMAPILFSYLHSLVSYVLVKNEAQFKQRKELYELVNRDDFFLKEGDD
ncbi:MurR/RpiR family transcriptional regulator [Bacillus tianshenii]|nr:MurR/RpiR family transcriptional regulator [Bacillus tianshenii]